MEKPAANQRAGLITWRTNQLGLHFSSGIMGLLNTKVNSNIGKESLADATFR
jgi:hypothetical protein